ncbi:MAG: PIN domain-containing protein, partial [Lachnospiraceae bacterium]|nr:PIN domain-containing protein [Lachnospiraceae bacterium]
YYIAYQTLRNKDKVKQMLRKLLKIVLIASVSGDEIRNALALPWRDFEDSVQYSVALLQEMDGIVTRNLSDYKEAEMKVWKPEEFFLLWQ